MRKLLLLTVICFPFFIHSSAQIITTIVGNGIGGFSGNGGPATAAELDPYGITVDKIGNVYISDNDSCVRKINTSGIISTFAGNGVRGYSGDGGLATTAELKAPQGLTTDGIGNIYIADTYNNRIREVNTSGIISTFAGNGFNRVGGYGGYSGDGGPATAAELDEPYGIAVDKLGNVYIADTHNQVIRKVNTSGIISTFAGNGYGAGLMSGGGYYGDGGPATAAEFFLPNNVAIDNFDNVYISDYDNHRIRIVDTSGIINTFAGDSVVGYSGDGGSATTAEIYTPLAVTVDDSGVYIADDNNIRKVNPSGIISTFAGNDSIIGFSGDGGPATTAELSYVTGLALDTSGNLYIVDDGNARIRKVWMVLAVSDNSITDVNCNGESNGSAIAMASEGLPPYTYSWSNGATTSSVSNLSAGTYTVNVVDSENIKGSTIVIIAQPPLLTASANVITNVICNGANSGSASAITTGGTSPYTYLWSDANSQTTISVTGLSAGTYTINITDNNGCISPATVIITQPMALIASANAIINVNCNGGNNGSASVTVSGGTSPYNYLWSDANSQATISASGLIAGTYTATITDYNGCSIVSTITITQPTAISMTADSINVTGTCNGSAWVVVGGGTPSYSYLWMGGLTSDTITNQCIGDYCCTVTDANGCIDSLCTTIELATGTNEVKGESGELMVYPNPNNGTFTIALSHPELARPDESVGRVSGSQPKLKIYNVLGQQIYFATLNQVQPARTGTGGGDNLIDLSDKPNGIYLYKVFKETGELVGEGKVIILR